MPALPKHVESIHPALWRGSQLARAYGKTVDTGYAALSAELPGGGWPLGALVELLVQQPGVGEFRLLRPALAELSRRPIALLQAPHVPNSLAFSYLGLPLDKLIQLRAPKYRRRALVRRAGAASAKLRRARLLAAAHPRRGPAAAAPGRAGDGDAFSSRPAARQRSGCVAGHVATRRAFGRWRHRRRRHQATRTDTKRDAQRRPATLTDSAQPSWPYSSPFTCPGFRWRYSVRGGRLGRRTAASCWTRTRSPSPTRWPGKQASCSA